MDNVSMMVDKLKNDDEIDIDYISPNFVADYAYNKGISLTSDEIVEISRKV